MFSKYKIRVTRSYVSQAVRNPFDFVNLYDRDDFEKHPHAVFIRPKKDVKDAPGAVIMPGYTGSLTRGLLFGNALADAGIPTLVAQHRNEGLALTKDYSSRRRMLKWASRFVPRKHGTFHRDLRIAMDYLADEGQNAGVNGTRVAAGYSMGGYEAYRFNSADVTFTVNPYLPLWGRSVARSRTMFIIGSNDKVADPDAHGRRLFLKASSPALMIEYIGGHHDLEYGEKGHDALQRAAAATVAEWTKLTLGGGDLEELHPDERFFPKVVKKV